MQFFRVIQGLTIEVTAKEVTPIEVIVDLWGLQTAGVTIEIAKEGALRASGMIWLDKDRKGDTLDSEIEVKETKEADGEIIKTNTKEAVETCLIFDYWLSHFN